MNSGGNADGHRECCALISAGSEGGMVNDDDDSSSSGPENSDAHRLRETSAFQDNTFEGCNSATHQIHAVGEGFCRTPFCDCSAAAALVSAAGNTFEACNVADPQIHAVGEGLCTTPFCDCSAVASVNTICRITHDTYGKTKICRITDQSYIYHIYTYI